LSRHEQCLELIRRYYADVPMKDALLDEELQRRIDSGVVFLDAGCGAEVELANRYADVARMGVGVEFDPGVRRTGLAWPVRADLEALPFETASFDIVVSREVCEHLKDPVTVFSELRRVLKEGGAIVFVTPNKYDYSSLVSRLMPFRLKRRFLRTVFGKDAYDNFPTFYRMNTRRAIAGVARRTGLRVERIVPIRHYPYYLMFSRTLFFLGILFDRAIARLRLTGLYSSFLVVLTPMGRLNE